MRKKYKNIEEAPVIELNERAEEISIQTFPESVQIHMNIYREGDMSFSEKHWHRLLQFNVVLEGVLQVSVNDKKITIEKGDGIFINKNVLHCLNPKDIPECVSYSLQIPASAICPEKDIPIFEKYVAPIIDSEAINYLIFKREETRGRKILELLDYAAHKAEKQDFAYELKVKAAIVELWTVLLEYVESLNLNQIEVDHVMSVGAERMKEMMSYIQKHYKEKITLDDIAEASNVSISECNRVFHRFLDATPIEYLNRVRIVQACALLRREEEKASAIGEMVGFTEYSYFHRVFKKYMGCTPKEYQTYVLGNMRK